MGGFNKMKKQKTEDLASSSDECDTTVEYLNDDCMLHIFQYLTAAEKINAETVCKNWNRVLKMSWSDVRSLHLHTILPFRCEQNFNSLSKAKNTAYLINILKRRGIYLHELKISVRSMELLVYSEVINEIPKYCNNITEVNLKQGTDGILNDESLKVLFSKNPNINSISLRNFNLIGDCLLNLDTKQIKKIRLENCKFESHGYFHGFIANLKNLTVLKIYGGVENINIIIDALIMGNTENLLEIKLILYQKSYVRNLSLLLSRQKKVRKVELQNILFNQSFLEKLPIECLEYLALDFKEVSLENDQIINLPLILSKQSKIRILKLGNILIDMKLMKNQETFALTENLEEFCLTFENTQHGEIVLNLSLFLSKLKKLRKLEVESVKVDEKFMKSIPSEFLEELSLDIRYKGQPIETLLKYLENFKNLYSFDIRFHIMSYYDLEIIYKFINKNIKILKINLYDYVSSAKQITDFSRLQNLETLIINNTNDLVVETNNILFENTLMFKNIKHLSINYCDFEDFISGLSSFENLVSLNTNYASMEDEEFTDVIKVLKNLKELRISSSENVTENFILSASEVKLQRGDTHILKIFIHFCTKFNFDLLNVTPLISVKEF